MAKKAKRTVAAIKTNTNVLNTKKKKLLKLTNINIVEIEINP
jgi:hypothetical protein